MKTRLLLVCALLLTTCLVSAQSKRTYRSPMSFVPSAVHNSSDDRGNAPPNDDCANAQVISLANDCDSPITGDNTEATNDGPDTSCDNPGPTLLDMWYTFNSGVEDTAAITLTPGAQMTDWAFVVYDACGGAEVACVLTPASTAPVVVVPGTDYWIRVYSNTLFGDPGPFTLCVSTPGILAPPPPNDLCANVVPQPLAIGSTVTFTGTTVGAVENDGGGFPSVWEGFSLGTCADVKISYCTTAPAFGSFYTILNLGCPPGPMIHAGSYEDTSCGDGNFTICFPDLAPGDYFYAVIQSIGSFGPYTLNVSAEACGTSQAMNDECAGAIPLIANASCITQTFSPSCASQSLPAVDCGGFIGNANDDVWYSFTATAADMTVGGSPNGAMDIAMELFSGSCGSLTSIACGDIGGQGVPDDMVATGLTVGNTYYMRVYDFLSQYAWQDPSYQLCVVEGVGSGVGIEDGASAEAIVLFPNPNNGNFSVHVDPHSSSIMITIIDATGRAVLVRNERNTASGFVQVHAEGQLAHGFYTVRVDDGRTLSATRLIIE